MTKILKYWPILCHARPMKWVGLTGGIASGKTTTANLFRELRVPVVDADQLAHQALRRSQDKIVTYFGREILDDKGEINRKALGDKVFSDPKRLKQLENLIHPFVKKQSAEKRKLFESAGKELAIYDVPLLFENNMKDQFDQVILVYIPEDVSKQRLIERSGLSEKEVEARIKSQMDIEKKKEMADVVFDNQGDIDALRAQVAEFYKSITE